jgi:hypothetical protein
VFNFGDQIYCIDTERRRKPPCKVISGNVAARVIREEILGNMMMRHTTYELDNGMSFGELICFGTEEEADIKCAEMNERRMLLQSFR